MGWFLILIWPHICLGFNIDCRQLTKGPVSRLKAGKQCGVEAIAPEPKGLPGDWLALSKQDVSVR